METFEDKLGDVVVFNDKQWISWLNGDSCRKRLSSYSSVNWAGTVEWAIDLSWSFDGPDGTEPDDGAW